jgi:hypothetical protein
MVRVVHVVPQPLCGRLEPEAQQGLHVQAAVPSPPGHVAAVQIESHAVVDGGGSPRVPPSPRRISVVEGKNITSEPSADQCCGGEKITSEPSADQCGGGEKYNLRALSGSVLWRGKNNLRALSGSVLWRGKNNLRALSGSVGLISPSPRRVVSGAQEIECKAPVNPKKNRKKIRKSIWYRDPE